MNRKFLVLVVGLLCIGCASSSHSVDSADSMADTEMEAASADAEMAKKEEMDAMDDSMSGEEGAEEKGSLVERASYGIGLNFGRNLSRQGADFDMEKIVAGLTDGIEGNEAWLDDEEIRTSMQEMQKKWMEDKRLAREALAETNLAEGEAFLAENGAREGVTTTESGLQYEILTEGDGEIPVAEDRVEVHYTGTLLDGTVFDSSRDRGQPAKFGVTRVIKGWTEALQMMPVGSTWKLVIPSELAYAERGAGQNIGPNATLTFEVELLGIEQPAEPVAAPAASDDGASSE